MSRGPRRLMDDPDFQWETGCNLRDEALLTEGYDLARLRASVLSTVPEVGDGVPLIRARRGLRWWGLGSLLGLSTVTAFWLGTQVSGIELDAATEEASPTVAPTSPVVVPTPPSAAEIDPELTPADAPEPAPQALTAEPVAPRAPSAVSTVPQPSPGGVEADPAPPEAGPAEPDATDAAAEVVSGGRSRLAAELAVFEPANDALEGGESSRAAIGFREYLAEFPEGRLRPEAELGLLSALHDLGDAARTERWAATLLDEPAHAERRDDIRELRAQALVRLGRCEEALETVDGLPGKVVAPIRRACRGR